MHISLFISFVVLILGTYYIWPSRYNIPAHTSLAFFNVAFLLPTLILPEIISKFNNEIVDLYTNIQSIGAVFYLLGMILGYKMCTAFINPSFLWFKISESSYCKKVSSMTIKITLSAIIGMFFSFYIMGFIPMFASDPIAAKFMRKDYYDPYVKVALLYRTCNYLLQFTVPLLLVLWYYYRKRIYLFLAVLSSMVLIGCFARGPAFLGIVLGMGIIAAHKKRLFKYYILFLFLIYTIGSMAYYLIGAATYGLDDNAGILRVMHAGSSDVSDHLQFLTSFTRNPEYTYGRTFGGGLIPYHYYWNPSIWSLHILSGGVGDVNDMVSGGLRLSLPIWGYVAFSWSGVVFLSLIVGFLTGKFIKKTQHLLIKTDNLIIQAIIIMLYMKVYSFFINFHLLSMYNLPVLFIMFFYLYRFKRSILIEKSKLKLSERVGNHL